jgi:hypothetical protein
MTNPFKRRAKANAPGGCVSFSGCDTGSPIPRGEELLPQPQAGLTERLVNRLRLERAKVRNDAELAAIRLAKLDAEIDAAERLAQIEKIVQALAPLMPKP